MLLQPVHLYHFRYLVVKIKKNPGPFINIITIIYNPNLVIADGSNVNLASINNLRDFLEIYYLFEQISKIRIRY